ncbi:class I SAM-dependent methyltransferase [Dactylosporangium sp. AC04546]|uniref:class I SAM-dependent DNA methyltransferase n=1 Tax=Dactylosporangium sp. AC04546 TaxID=2862460 RepID=UPI001EDF8CF0|nr:class I SAM-dependent methyltransferase [Dactylosporangium sp. AC04546]WVK79991.1 class I SAM-dependent methyltransferase [Dactylosporangium sp. AC04546]
MRPPDAIFAHPRLAPIYDTFDGDRGDLDAYAALVAELGARTVLDVGCGTGSLAVLLDSLSYTVVGVDPAAESLAVARAKSDRVTWIHGDVSAVPALGADLATMTGNVAQVFLTDEDWAATLRGIHGALRPGGRFVFETRRPAYRAWEEWGGVEVRDGIEQCVVVTEVRLPFVSFRKTYRFPSGEVFTSDSTLRFRDHDELVTSLTAAGFRVLDVRQAPDRPGREYVFVTQRS